MNEHPQNPPTPPFDFEKYGIGTSDVKAEAAHLQSQGKKRKGLFKIKPGKQWMNESMNRPVPKMLFSEFWYESELCILFADTNAGKSVLAMQIADSITTGRPIPGFKIETEKQPVLYFDFELNDKQFENRYSVEYTDHYPFDDNFLRSEIDPDDEMPDNMNFEDYLMTELETAVVELGIKVLIIDNITYLKDETEKAKTALPLMKQLKALKNKHGLSILTLAHTPKRNQANPITRNDLQGSKMLMNFCDSSFSIGESFTDINLRYIKQVKQRNTRCLYGADNVCTCQIDKPHNFLKFELLGFNKESAHLKQFDNQEEEDRAAKVLHLSKEGKTLRQIAAEVGLSHVAVGNLLKKLQ